MVESMWGERHFPIPESILNRREAYHDGLITVRLRT